MNLPTANKIKQTEATCLEKLVQWNQNKIIWLTFAMIHSIEIAFLFISFKCFRLEREQIRQIVPELEQLTSDTSFTLEKAVLKRAEGNFRVARWPC